MIFPHQNQKEAHDHLEELRGTTGKTATETSWETFQRSLSQGWRPPVPCLARPSRLSIGGSFEIKQPVVFIYEKIIKNH